MAGHPQAGTYLFLSPAGAPRFIDAWLRGRPVFMSACRQNAAPVLLPTFSHLIGFSRRNILGPVGKIPNKMNRCAAKGGFDDDHHAN